MFSISSNVLTNSTWKLKGLGGILVFRVLFQVWIEGVSKGTILIPYPRDAERAHFFVTGRWDGGGGQNICMERMTTRGVVLLVVIRKQVSKLQSQESSPIAGASQSCRKSRFVWKNCLRPLLCSAFYATVQTRAKPGLPSLINSFGL